MNADEFARLKEILLRAADLPATEREASVALDSISEDRRTRLD